MSKKKYDIEKITNELEGGASLFFARHTKPAQPQMPDNPEHNPVQQTPPPVATPAEKPTLPQPVPPPVPRPVPRTPEALVPKIKRPIRQRQPFDIFEDQYSRLKEIAEAEKGFVNGRGMSQMVREAIDMYLKIHSPKE